MEVLDHENILQSAATFDKTITVEAVYSIASLARPKEIVQVFEKAIANDFIGARNKLLDIMLQYGLSGIDMIIQLQREIWKVENISNERKLSFVKQCGEAEFRLIEGSDEFIQLEALIAHLTME